MSCRFLRFGRSAVGHRLPAVRVGRRDPALLRRAPSVHLAQARRRTIPGQRPRSRAGQRLRLRLQRHRDRRRLDPYPRLETAGQDVRVAGLHGGTSAGAFRLPDERLQVRRTPSRRSGLRFRPALLALRRFGVDPRLHRLPEKQQRPRHDARRTGLYRPGAARRVTHSIGKTGRINQNKISYGLCKIASAAAQVLHDPFSMQFGNAHHRLYMRYCGHGRQSPRLGHGAAASGADGKQLSLDAPQGARTAGQTAQIAPLARQLHGIQGFSEEQRWLQHNARCTGLERSFAVRQTVSGIEKPEILKLQVSPIQERVS